MPRDIDSYIQWNKSYYENNQEQEKARVKARRQQIAKYIRDYKSKRKCIFKKNCASKNPRLEFHHKDPDKKFKEISKMVYQGYSLKRIKAEIKKCILVCRRCHILHFHPNLSEALSLSNPE